jgi:hypothetical protein
MLFYPRGLVAIAYQGSLAQERSHDLNAEQRQYELEVCGLLRDLQSQMHINHQ